MKKKLSLAVLLCLAMVSCAWAEARIFVEYPTLGECTGDNVRIRSKPDTKSEAIGTLNEYDKIIVLRKVNSGKDVWYEVQNPKSNEEAYVFGKYLAPAYRQEFQRSAAAKLLTNIRLTYGSTPENMSFFAGKPEKLTRDHTYNVPLIAADWGDYRALYWESVEETAGSLKSLEVKSGTKPFGSLHIGDSTDKLTRELGSPENKSDTLWEYEFYLRGYDDEVEELVDACIFRFSIDDGKISRMYYYNHENGEEIEKKW